MLARIFSFALIAIVLVPALGTFPAFLRRQAEIRSEIKGMLKSGVPDNELHRITFHKVEDIHWTRPEKEFSLKGHMYDVVKNLSKNGKIEFLCINDVEEEVLFANLDDLVGHKHKKQSGSYQWTSFLLSQSMLPSYNGFILDKVECSERLIPVNTYSGNLTLGHPDELFSPPQI